MGRRVDSAVWDQRREWVQKQTQSGLSAGKFCRENSLNLNNFQAWKRRLNRTDQSEKSSAHSRSGKKSLRVNSESLGYPAFVQIPTATVASSSWIEVSLSEGIVVRLPSTNLAALRLVLAVLKPASEVNHV
jgi:hypothetical protein